ncbi:MAG: hypothetical protein IC227_11385 [Enterococcus lacertideformus]|uniref:Uncharacterized protein n=1 Tax=Enterococcus lacertideformus TaxID=2771493 RepID=A0A931FCG1_9ENTE|nr:hypothetical protein [Enterococcus lacertideformus]
MAVEDYLLLNCLWKGLKCIATMVFVVPWKIGKAIYQCATKEKQATTRDDSSYSGSGLSSLSSDYRQPSPKNRRPLKELTGDAQRISNNSAGERTSSQKKSLQVAL